MPKRNKILPGCEKIVPTSKEISNVPNYLSDAGGLTDCGNINSRYTQALELHCGDLLNCHRYYRVDVPLTADEKGWVVVAPHLCNLGHLGGGEPIFEQ
jgi:hypothetical protein